MWPRWLHHQLSTWRDDGATFSLWVSHHPPPSPTLLAIITQTYHVFIPSLITCKTFNTYYIHRPRTTSDVPIGEDSSWIAPSLLLPSSLSSPFPRNLPAGQWLATNLGQKEINILAEQRGLTYGWLWGTFTFAKQTLYEWLSHLYSLTGSFDHHRYLNICFGVVQTTVSSTARA